MSWDHLFFFFFGSVVYPAGWDRPTKRAVLSQQGVWDVTAPKTKQPWNQIRLLPKVFHVALGPTTCGTTTPPTQHIPFYFRLISCLNKKKDAKYLSANHVNLWSSSQLIISFWHKFIQFFRYLIWQLIIGVSCELTLNIWWSFNTIIN